MRIHLPAAFFLSFIVSVGITPLARQIAIRTGMLDYPAPRKIHRRPTPLLGGVAIYAAAILTLLMLAAGSKIFSQTTGIVGGATLLLAVGLLDDRGLLHSQVKLFLAMPLSAIILIVSGVRITTFSPLLNLLGHSLYGSPLWFALNYALTFFWVIGITAAFSILDHMDGLCAGVAAIASAFFLYFAIVNGQILVRALAVAVLGASLGFLTHNFSPARIFMGDAGAMFLGFMMAVLGLKIRPANVPGEISWMVPLFILSVPIFDTTLVTISRLRRGLIPFASPGKDHTAHRLARLGLGQIGAVLAMYSLGVIGGLLSILVAHLPVPMARWLFLLSAVSTLIAIAWLEKIPCSEA